MGVLAIDIGNTNIKMAAFDGDRMLAGFRLESNTLRTSDEYLLLIKQFLNQSKIEKDVLNGAAISSVIPRFNHAFTQAVFALFGTRPLIVGEDGVETGLKMCYQNSKEIGADRIAASVAAYRLYGAPCIVADFGTATVLNAISEKGEFLGGSITVGIKTALDTLVEKTARLADVELSFPQNCIGTSTAENLRSGIILGTIGGVEYIIEKMRAQHNLKNAKVVATGGLSELIKKGTSIIDCVDRALSLKGLNEIWLLNRAQNINR